MAVARIGAGAGGTSTGAAVTFNGPAISTSDANTVAIVGVVISVSSSSTATTCAVTWGGTAMTQKTLTLVGTGTARAAVGIYYLFNPGTGTASVVVTPGGASTKAQVRCQALAFSGVGIVGAAQTATATTHAPTSVTNGYDVRVLSNGGALSSPNQTQEYLAGASVGGAGDYMCMQSAAGTGSTISFTCSGTASTPQSVAVALAEPLAKMETLTEAFASGLPGTWGVDPPGATTSASGGGMRVDHTSATSYVYAFHNGAYLDLTSSYAMLEFTDFGASVAGHDRGLEVQVSAGNAVGIAAAVDQLYAYRYVAASYASVGTAITLDTTAHRWLQIRESAGTIYFDTAPDGSTFTNRWTLTNPFAITSAYPQVSCGNFATGTAGYVVVDNLNLPPVASATSFFALF